MKVKLSVNVDHVATLRQARLAFYPDPLAAARIAEEAGADGITIHLRSDRRHIQDNDVSRLREAIDGKLNLEMAVTEEMISVALATRPDQVSLVPERPEEVTTEGGLDLTGSHRVASAAERLSAAGIIVSIFVDPDPRQITELERLVQHGVAGFEINTDRYTRSEGMGTSGVPASTELERIARCASLGGEAGLAVYAGHGLTTGNVGPVAALPKVEELNIGHSIVGRAVLIGMKAAVREMLAAIQAAAPS
ncbi:MAG: pyridoxine 5'-phosphate synthase [Acidobacteriota bacterium]|nr:pyridoxine 5'-phosphate synthase [Acidobacteriota bacterium]